MGGGRVGGVGGVGAEGAEGGERGEGEGEESCYKSREHGYWYACAYLWYNIHPAGHDEHIRSPHPQLHLQQPQYHHTCLLVGCQALQSDGFWPGEALTTEELVHQVVDLRLQGPSGVSGGGDKERKEECEEVCMCEGVCVHWGCGCAVWV